jgi:calnexin
VWSPKKIPNPDYFEDPNPFVSLKPIAAVGFELWSMQSDIAFDNIILSTDQSVVDQWTAQTWDLKQLKEGGGKSAAQGMFDSVVSATEDKPWLWLIYVVVILLPFVLIYTFCFPSKDKTSDRKKTDEPTPDDEPTEFDDNVSNRSVESTDDELLLSPDIEPVSDPTEAKARRSL